jgi:hypothetical protein
MKKIVTGVTLAVFALAPAMVWADCGGAHDQASMASAKSADKTQQAEAQATSKATTHVVAKKAPAKQTVAKRTSPTKTEGSTVVAKNN